MNTLITNIHPIGASASKVLFKSDFNEMHTVLTLQNDKIEHVCHVQNTNVMREYLRGFVKSRVIAYTKKGVHYDSRRQKLDNLLHHLEVFKPRDPKRFYAFVLSWESLLINSLPLREDISHTKINSIIANCNKHFNGF